MFSSYRYERDDLIALVKADALKRAINNCSYVIDDAAIITTLINFPKEEVDIAIVAQLRESV